MPVTGLSSIHQAAYGMICADEIRGKQILSGKGGAGMISANPQGYKNKKSLAFRKEANIVMIKDKGVQLCAVCSI